MSDKTTQGVRVEMGAGDELPQEMPVGGYAVDSKGLVWCRVPGSTSSLRAYRRLDLHQSVVHEDGTITVSPSILALGHDGVNWHGFLERGVWREV